MAAAPSETGSQDLAPLVAPARELVSGDIVRARPGDIVPPDGKLLTRGKRGPVGPYRPIPSGGQAAK